MVKVINLFGGASVGKSTLAAELFYKMRVAGYRCELVQEWIKTWAYEERNLSPFDQFYVIGKQIRKESFLYDKVDYIVTDSPLWIAAFYENFNTGNDYIEKHVANFTEFAETQGVSYHNFVLNRIFKYDQVGRFHTEEESIKIDYAMKDYLSKVNLDYIDLDMESNLRADFIIQEVTKS